ncbi:MAG: hypothetical protein II949_11365 [Prevotella sp.]|jgi:hypothetical protein|nr:hypothetical protein [Prevotella sp.]
MPKTVTSQSKYQTLEEIRLRKEQLYEALQQDSKQIGQTWNQLFVSREDTTRSEYIMKMLSYGVTAFDAYMTVRKLRRNYGGLLSLIGIGKSKRKLKK